MITYLKALFLYLVLSVVIYLMWKTSITYNLTNLTYYELLANCTLFYVIYGEAKRGEL